MGQGRKDQEILSNAWSNHICVEEHKCFRQIVTGKVLSVKASLVATLSEPDAGLRDLQADRVPGGFEFDCVEDPVRVFSLFREPLTCR